MHHSWFVQIKLAIGTKCYVWGCYHFMWLASTPLNSAKSCICHLAMSHAPYLRIAHLCFDCALYIHVCAFASSRLDADTEQFEKEFIYITPEDRVRVFSSDLTGEPTPSPILHFHALWSIATPMLRFGCVTCPTPPVTLYYRITPPRPTCCLMIASFASRRRV